MLTKQPITGALRKKIDQLKDKEGIAMRKLFIYFLCVSFLLLTSGFHTMVAEANETGRPIGEMISRGDVKFEVRENVWKDVEPSNFPLFKGTKIKTGKGSFALTLTNDNQIEVGQNSLLSFDQSDQIRLIQGTLNFRIPSTAELSFKVGNLTVGKYRPLQASKNPSGISPVREETIGSISVHPNGAVTVKSIRGALAITNQEHAVMASLSSKDTVTIPSVTAKSPSKIMVAQAGETATAGDEDQKKKFLGLAWWWWAGFAGAAAVGAIIAVAAGGGGGGGGGTEPVCP